VEAASGTADSGDPERDLAVLLVEVGQVAQSGGTGAVFFLDEMQALDATALAAVCMSMNRVGQRGLPVALVGAGLPPLPRLLRGAKPYAERMFAYHELDRLSDAEARMALVAPAALREVEYEAPAVELVLKASAGYPHFIQEYGRVLWNEVDSSPITARDIKGRAGAHHGGAQPALLQGSLRDGLRCRAALPRGDGRPRGRACALGRCGASGRVQGAREHFRAPGESAAEGPGLQPAAWACGLYGAVVRRVSAGAASAGKLYG